MQLPLENSDLTSVCAWSRRQLWTLNLLFEKRDPQKRKPEKRKLEKRKPEKTKPEKRELEKTEPGKRELEKIYRHTFIYHMIMQ